MNGRNRFIISVVMAVKRFLQQDISDIGARYTVYDDCGAMIYRLRGKTTASGESMKLSDPEGKVLCKVRRLGFNAFGAYSISAGDVTVRLNIAVGGGRASVRFRGISFCIRGDVLSGSYDIIDADKTVVCAVYRDYRKGCTHLEINNKERELICIAAVACINSLRADAMPVLQMT